MTDIQHAKGVEMCPLSMTLNGQAFGPIDMPSGLPMIDFLYEYAGLTGSRLGCGQGSATRAW